MSSWEIAVMAMIAASVAGFAFAEGERTRVRYIQAMRRCLMRMNDIIRYEQPPLTGLFRRINLHQTPQEKQLTALLHAAACRIETSTNPQLDALFSRECAKARGYPALNREDREAFESLLFGLGRTGLNEQLRLIEAADIRLSRREAQLSEECTRKMRLIRTLGVTGGAAMFLLLV
jgi:stage III sporulation protein AB